MAIGDEDQCPYHESRIVAVFCQTCEEMVCTLCISQGPHAGARHRDHAFLDLVEAFDAVREDMEKVTARFKEHLEQKKKERQGVQGTLQQTKRSLNPFTQFELLRKRSLLERRSRALRDGLLRAEARHLRELEALVSPGLTRADLRARDVDYEVDLLSRAGNSRYEVVSREGMLGSAESLSRLPSSRAVTYLKHVIKTKREMLKAMDKDSRTPSVQDQLEQQASGFRTLRRVSLSLHRERRTVGRVFRMPAQVPSAPRVLYSWSVVGATNASVVWKFVKSEHIDRFIVCYHPVHVRSAPSDASFSVPCKRRSCVKMSIRPGRAGRATLVLRGLQQRAWYKVQIQGTNLLGNSKPCIAFFVTRSEPSDWFKYEGEVFTRAPKSKMAAKLPVCMFRVLLVVVVALYGVILLYVALYNYDRLSSEVSVTVEGGQMIETGGAARGQHCRCFVEEVGFGGSLNMAPSEVEYAEEKGGDTVTKWFTGN